jgi:protoporphyrinogen/coproporphyrinogen III oxidase
MAGLNAGAKPHVVIVGGGIAGLTAAFWLRHDPVRVTVLTVLEASSRLGASGAPVATRVSRWDDALPQYTVGHLDRVTQIRETVAALPGLAVCGALYDGVGVGVCMATARKAADQVRTWLNDKEDGTS